MSAKILQFSPLERLRHHVTGAIERGETEAIIEQPDDDDDDGWFKVPCYYGCGKEFDMHSGELFFEDNVLCEECYNIHRRAEDEA